VLAQKLNDLLTSLAGARYTLIRWGVRITHNASFLLSFHFDFVINAFLLADCKGPEREKYVVECRYRPFTMFLL